jgi:hypothetical protein
VFFFFSLGISKEKGAEYMRKISHWYILPSVFAGKKGQHKQHLTRGLSSRETANQS